MKALRERLFLSQYYKTCLGIVNCHFIVSPGFDFSIKSYRMALKDLTKFFNAMQIYCIYRLPKFLQLEVFRLIFIYSFEISENLKQNDTRGSSKVFSNLAKNKLEWFHLITIYCHLLLTPQLTFTYSK